RPAPSSTLFPYTTLFRSLQALRDAWQAIVGQPSARSWPVIEMPHQESLFLLLLPIPAIGAGNLLAPKKHHGPLESPCQTCKTRRSEEHTSELQSRENLVC